MGELLDSIMDGEICDQCMSPFEVAYGYQETCAECEDD